MTVDLRFVLIYIGEPEFGHREPLYSARKSPSDSLGPWQAVKTLAALFQVEPRWAVESMGLGHGCDAWGVAPNLGRGFFKTFAVAVDTGESWRYRDIKAQWIYTHQPVTVSTDDMLLVFEVGTKQGEKLCRDLRFNWASLLLLADSL